MVILVRCASDRMCNFEKGHRYAYLFAYLQKHIPVSPFHEMKCKLCEQIKHFLTEKILAYSVVCVNRFFVKIKIFA